MADKAGKKKRKSIFSRIGGFFKEVRIETFKRITWPTPKQVLNNTIVVLVTVLIVGVLIWILDFIFTGGLQFVLNELPEIMGK